MGFARYRSWAVLDRERLLRNYRICRSFLPQSASITAVVKADAYGHGAALVAKCLGGAGCENFAVADAEEALSLRRAGISGNILIFGYTPPHMASVLYENGFTQALPSVAYAEALAESGFSVRCLLAVDTGMNRVGIPARSIAECAAVVRSLHARIPLRGLFTHLSAADSSHPSDIAFTYRQLERFWQLADAVRDLSFEELHCYNSAGGLRYASLYPLRPCHVRLGIMLYGLSPGDGTLLPEGILPVLSWYAAVVAVKWVPCGDFIGYGRAFCAPRDMRIATVSAGYGDGYRRALGEKGGFVLLHGKRAPIVGRISMDQMTVDVTDIPEAKVGDAAVLIGESGGEAITADGMAVRLDTIGYEIVSGISHRVTRIRK